MSRVAKNPLIIPKDVNVSIQGRQINVKGSKGSLNYQLPENIAISQQDSVLTLDFDTDNKVSKMMAGTTRANLNNLLIGVSKGFEQKLMLIGVGYRAQMKGKTLGLNLGFSHSINFAVPEGITIETPSQTEIVVKGINKQQVGQIAANIREFRPPEPYKGKGVRYADEYVIRKDAKKK